MINSPWLALDLKYLSILFFFISACSSQPVSIKEKPFTPSDFKNEIFVLGTMHLSAIEQFDISFLKDIPMKLESWNPTQICVESRNPREIYEVSKFAKFHKGHKEMLRQFDIEKVKISELENRRLKMTFEKAYFEAKQLRANPRPTNFEKIIKLSLVSFDLPNALLYWSRLTNKKRKAIKLDIKSKKFLNKWLQSNNEISSLAVRLAKNLKLKEICSIDSQIAGTRVLVAPKKDLEELFSSPERSTFRNSNYFKKYLKIENNSIKSKDLTPIYEHMNKSDVALQDEKQWDWLHRDYSKTGLNRLRFISWERRNTNMVANILEASQTREKEKILVIVGAAHKSILERMLHQNRSIKIINYQSVIH